uniref:Transmembrane channel-like protein n=1 Tax=Amphilophus citrinellus TaxID=61819 RepID=A0A3Q0R1S2_AMPCI
MGAFFSPCLPAFNVLKLIGLMYLRSWAVLTCNVPHQQVFRASSNNFYLAMLLFMLFLCMLPTIFAIVRYRPSQHCGPFGQEKIYDIISETVSNDFPVWFSKMMTYITSPVVVLPALLLMLIYYLQSIARSLKFTNNQLRMQLQTERTEDKKKVFQMAASGACRSKSYHHMTCNPPPHCSDSIHSDPLYRKTIRSVHPVEGARLITSQNYGVRRGHTTRYLIVNEHESRKKLLRSATRIPRHYFMEEPAEILELYPLNVRRYTPCTTYHQPHHYRSYSSQQHLSEEEGDEDQRKGRRKMSLGKAHRPRSLSDLHQPPHFYIGDRVENRITIDKEKRTARGRYRAQEKDEEEDGVGEVGWGGAELHSQSQASVRVADPLFLQTRRHIHSPGRPCLSPTGPRHTESHVKSKTKPKLETPQTESDSASLASSSDQQNSSADQYIQVINNKERYLKSEARQGKTSKKKFKTSFELKNTESNDLLCSNV